LKTKKDIKPFKYFYFGDNNSNGLNISLQKENTSSKEINISTT